MFLFVTSLIVTCYKLDIVFKSNNQCQAFNLQVLVYNVYKIINK